ncbi:MAG: nucleoside triphosphate pyrophosphohydrolase [Firmicutes bacterium]|nr:nucleoside triphosphate pyrophosphohydrolase [Bacillota bacterium]
MRELRSEHGCPWDREQTHQSLKKYLIEETYEVLEAIDEGDPSAICEELGDVLLQIVFHAQIADENKHFNMEDVITGICNKLVRRHPHVFADVKVENAEEVARNWEAIKQDERSNVEFTSILDGIPKSLPALSKAEKVQLKAAKYGFDWDRLEDVLTKLDEELTELKAALKDNERIEEEFGDLLFSLVNISRFISIDAESALQRATNKFIKRFQYIEKEAAKRGQSLESMTLNEMDKLWEMAKKF